MRIANLNINGEAKVAASSGGNWLDLTAALQILDITRGKAPIKFPSIQSLLDAGRFSVEEFRQATAFVGDHQLHGLIQKEDELVLEAPLARPGQIIALARNYTAHAQESTLPAPREPNFFCKANTSVAGPGQPVVLPPNLGRIEPEIELAFVIKQRASHIRADEAAAFIAGYTILNDVSAQELQAREIRENYPLFRCKSLETFTPIGPWLVTVDEIGLAPALDMTLRVNGEIRVATNTAGLTFGIAKLLEFISGYIVLLPGDVITTGCPKAAGPICPGDLMELKIEKIGILRNPVVAGTELCPA